MAEREDLPLRPALLLVDLERRLERCDGVAEGLSLVEPAPRAREERRGAAPFAAPQKVPPDLRLALPMMPGVSSLNLATAVSATLFALTIET